MIVEVCLQAGERWGEGEKIMGVKGGEDYDLEELKLHGWSGL